MATDYAVPTDTATRLLTERRTFPRITAGPLAWRHAALGAVLLVAAALTPISVVTSRNNTIDSLLVLTLLLGAWVASKAAETGRLRLLLLCALVVGLGFNIKMLQAYLVVPAFGLMYLLGAPRRWLTRI